MRALLQANVVAEDCILLLKVCNLVLTLLEGELKLPKLSLQLSTLIYFQIVDAHNRIFLRKRPRLLLFLFEITNGLKQ